MSLLRNDGKVTIYQLQTRADKSYKNGNWFDANLDHFGYPEHFSASGECWQTTGLFGVLYEHQGIAGLKHISKAIPDRDFRLVKRVLSQSTKCVAKCSRNDQL